MRDDFAIALLFAHFLKARKEWDFCIGEVPKGVSLLPSTAASILFRPAGSSIVEHASGLNIVEVFGLTSEEHCSEVASIQPVSITLEKLHYWIRVNSHLSVTGSNQHRLQHRCFLHLNEKTSCDGGRITEETEERNVESRKKSSRSGSIERGKEMEERKEGIK